MLQLTSFTRSFIYSVLLLPWFGVVLTWLSFSQVWACRDAGDTKTTWRDVTIKNGGIAII